MATGLIELGVVAATLRPELFPNAEAFRLSKAIDPRFLRELFSSNMVEVELREVKNLPPISPRPWEDLFSAEMIELNANHREAYNHLRESDEVRLSPASKIRVLLQMTTHPHRVRRQCLWPEAVEKAFDSWKISTKLVWLRERVAQELDQGAKVAIATGIYVEGITKPYEDEEVWVGQLLGEWFGKDKLLILDSSVSQQVKNESSDRARLIERWRNDPNIRILLVSMRTCPDSVNLTVKKQPGVTKLFLTALSFGWVPWKQFLGRFWRDENGVPVSYVVPVLKGTIDESLLQLIRRKWELQQLFLAQVPLTDEEMAYLDRKLKISSLAHECKSPAQRVNLLTAAMRGRGERDSERMLDEKIGTSTRGELFAQAYLETHDYTASGHVARCMKEATAHFQAQGLVHAEGILDAGCGPLVLERSLDMLVYGFDMNPYMIELARLYSPWQGKHAYVGRLSHLPDEWTGKFELTAASLVLHWTSLRTHKGNPPDRVSIVNELARVTHPAGRVWLTFPLPCMNELILSDWIETLSLAGFKIVGDLTGAVRSRDIKRRRPFTFWSLCFSPDGKLFEPKDPKMLRFLFEEARLKRIRGIGRDSEPTDLIKEKHYSFEIVRPDGIVVPVAHAADAAAKREAIRLGGSDNLQGWRFHRTPNLHWRVLQKLVERGLVDMGAQ